MSVCCREQEAGLTWLLSPSDRSRFSSAMVCFLRTQTGWMYLAVTGEIRPLSGLRLGSSLRITWGACWNSGCDAARGSPAGHRPNSDSVVTSYCWTCCCCCLFFHPEVQLHPESCPERAGEKCHTHDTQVGQNDNEGSNVLDCCVGLWSFALSALPLFVPLVEVRFPTKISRFVHRHKELSMSKGSTTNILEEENKVRETLFET